MLLLLYQPNHYANKIVTKIAKLFITTFSRSRLIAHIGLIQQETDRDRILECFPRIY
jgi:hypothetical protein